MPLTTVTAAQRMRADVDTIAATATTRQTLDLVLASRYQCVVVIDGERRPLGIVTEGDIVRHVLAEEAPGGSYLRAILASPEDVLQYLRDVERSHRNTAADLMSAPMVALAPGDTLLRAAELFHTHGFRQLAVVDGDRLIGLLLQHDVVRVIIEQHDAAERALREGGRS